MMKKKQGRSFTVNDILNSAVGGINQHLAQPVPDPEEEKKKSKYRANKTDVDGIPFDSKKEAARYRELKKKLKTGEIAFLARQVEYELNTDGNFSFAYIADFVYTDTNTGKVVVEDVKGFKTVEYKKKCKLMKKVHRIIIKEI